MTDQEKLAQIKTLLTICSDSLPDVNNPEAIWIGLDLFVSTLDAIEEVVDGE